MANAGDQCLGQHSVCLVRIAKLDTDCSPLGGAGSGFVTPAIATVTATPDYEEGQRLEPKNGCGQIMWTYEEDDVLKRINLTGEFVYHDNEQAILAYDAIPILGAQGGPYAGATIGFATPDFRTAARKNGVYLEIITKNVSAELGDCSSGAGGFPAYQAHVWGKVKMRLGDQTFAEGARMQPWVGVATANPSLYDGPWNDYPGAGYMKNAPYQTFGYSQEQFDAILAEADCGLATLPAGS